MTSKPLHRSFIILLVLTLAVSCIPAAPAETPTTSSAPALTATHFPSATPGPTETQSLGPTASPTSAPTSTFTPEPTRTPQTIRIDDTLSEVGYNLPLTIQHVSDTSATFFFELETPSVGVFLYRESGSDNQPAIIPFSNDKSRHQITVDGLISGADYHAVVGLSAGENLYQLPHYRGRDWGLVNFHTLGGAEPVRIGVIGDSGLGEGATMELAEQMASYDLDFVLHTGDVVYFMNQHPGPFDAYAEKYYQPLGPLLHNMPVYPVVGNHDIEMATLWEGKPFYYHAFPAFKTAEFHPSGFNGQNQWYAFTDGRFQFLMLDTQTIFGEGGHAEQTAWLEDRLRDERFDFTIPVFHVPPYSSGPHADEGLIVEQRWGHLFRADQIPVVLSGHGHYYERLEVDGITYLISGGGTSVLYNLVEEHPASQVFARRTHFVLLEIYTDLISISSISAAGELLDQFEIRLEAQN